MLVENCNLSFSIIEIFLCLMCSVLYKSMEAWIMKASPVYLQAGANSLAILMSPMFDNFDYFFHSKHIWQCFPGFNQTNSVHHRKYMSHHCGFRFFVQCWTNWATKKSVFFCCTVPFGKNTGSVVPIVSWLCFDYYQHKQHWIIFTSTCKQCIIFSVNMCMHIFDKLFA